MKNTNQLVEAASLSVVLPPSVAHFEQRGTLSGNLLSEREESSWAQCGAVAERHICCARTCPRQALRRLGAPETTIQPVESRSIGTAGAEHIGCPAGALSDDLMERCQWTGIELRTNFRQKPSTAFSEEFFLLVAGCLSATLNS